MDLESLLKQFKLIKQGAEGRLYSGCYLGRRTILKERFKKKYRHPILDGTLTRDRIKAEARALLRCKTAGVYSPAVYLTDLERNCIFMEEIENCVTVKDFLATETSGEQKPSKEWLTDEIGKSLARIHRHNIIHGDLTTSNMLVVSYEQEPSKLFLIDFGLSHMAQTAEDKAVDLYVLERAIVSTHPNGQQLLDKIIFSYINESKKVDSSAVMTKLKEVRARGRKRTMVG